MATVTAGYNWTSGETVTPAKLNSAAAPTVAVADDEITTAKILDANVTAAKMAATLDLSSKTVTLPDASVAQAKLAANVVGNGPAFRAYATTTTSLPNNTAAKVNLASESFDTNNNFASSRFTPSVAGYYQINASVYVLAAPQFLRADIYKNGSEVAAGIHTNQQTFLSSVSDVVYLNGTTDYVELYAIQASGTTQSVSAVHPNGTFMCGFLARAA
jgi:hypothetical protein